MDQHNPKKINIEATKCKEICHSAKFWENLVMTWSLYMRHTDRKTTH